MKKFQSVIWGVCIALAAVLVTAPQDASAVPAFARQTGQACNACHFQNFPTLSDFGRAFRAAGYTLGGEQGLVEGENLSIPNTLNASVVAKLRYVQTNGDGGDTRDHGEIQWPDEAALLIGGRLSEHAGFLMELGLAGTPVEGTADLGTGELDASSSAFLSTKVHFHVGDAGGAQFSVIPFSTDGLGAAYGFELLNTGAQRSQRPIEDRSGFSAAQTLGVGSGEATGVALVASRHDFFVNYSPWVPGWGGTHMNVTPSGLAHYFRAAFMPNLGGWDTGFGVQFWSGDAEVYDGASKIKIPTDAWVVDAQAQGSVGAMPLGIYASYGQCDAVAGHSAGGDCDNADDATAFGILGQLGVLPGKANVFLAYRTKDDGKATAEEFNSVTVGAHYLPAENIRLELYTVKEDGSGVDARANKNDSLTMLQLFAGF